MTPKHDHVKAQSFLLLQVADQNIKNLEELQDEYDFKVNTLKSRGEIILSRLVRKDASPCLVNYLQLSSLSIFISFKYQ